MPDKIGSRYRIGEQIGRGGMGVVYSAEDIALNRTVAIKFPAPDPHDSHAASRLIAEARAASRLEHPNIARIYDCGEDEDGRPYVVMELVAGESLSELLTKGPLAFEHACNVFEGILQGLREAHDHGILHRDIKPSNIMLTARGVKLLDFGLARRLAKPGPEDETLTAMTAPGTVRGTPVYMSPEQLMGADLDVRSDLYSAALVFYASVTGQRAFSGYPGGEVRARTGDRVPARPSSLRAGLPAAMDAFAARALARRPEDRFTNAGEMLEALADMRRRILRALRLRIAAATAAVVLAAILLWLLWPFYSGGPSAAAARWYNEGVAALLDGTYFKASRALERAAQADSSFPLIHARLAEAWSELDYSDKAKESLLRADAESRRLSRADALRIRAIRATLTRDFRAAIQIYTEILRGASASARPAALVDLGRAREKAGEMSAALDNYREAARLDPQHAAAFLHSGVLLGLQQNPAALDQLRKAEILFQASSNGEGLCEVEYQRGFIANVAQRLPEARQHFENTLALARAAGSEYHEINTLLRLSSLAYRMPGSGNAEALAAAALDRARNAGMIGLTANGLIDVGNALFLQGAYDAADSRYREALDIARRNGMRRVEARANLARGSNFIQSGSIAEGRTAVEEALRYFQPAHFVIETAQALTLLARAARQSGNYAEARSALESQLRLARERQDRALIAQAEEGLGRLLFTQEKLTEALGYFDRVLAASREQKNSLNIGYALLYRARALTALGDLDQAESALEEAGSIAESAGGPPILRPGVWRSRGELAAARRATAQAMRLFQNTLAVPDLSGPLRVDTLLELARVQLHAGMRRQARETATRVSSFTAQLSDPAVQGQLDFLSAEIAMESGEAREARARAERASAQFQKASQFHSGWRAETIAGLACNLLADAACAAGHARIAEDLLSRVRTELGEAPMKKYLALPEIQFYRERLSRIEDRYGIPGGSRSKER